MDIEVWWIFDIKQFSLFHPTHFSSQSTARENRNRNHQQRKRGRRALTQIDATICWKRRRKIVEKTHKYVQKVANNNNRKVKVTSIFKSKKLSSRFSLKDKTKPEHLHNLVYYIPCLYIKQYQPDLNMQEDSYKLSLFNETSFI